MSGAMASAEEEVAAALFEARRGAGGKDGRPPFLIDAHGVLQPPKAADALKSLSAPLFGRRALAVRSAAASGSPAISCAMRGEVAPAHEDPRRTPRTMRRG
jgi:hypothetical protein